MANITSAKKKVRRDKRAQLKNKALKKSLKQLLKKAGSKKELPAVYKALDKAAKRNIVHANKAGRLKSRMSLKLTANARKKPN